MNQPFHPSASPSTLAELLELHDEAFVYGAYQQVLGRTPDPGGLSNYLAQVRAGVGREQIAAELAQSPEGKLYRSELPGLGALIAEHRKRPSSLLGRLFRRFGRDILEPTQRQLRSMENSLYLMDQRLIKQAQQLDDLNALIQRIASSARDSGPKQLPSGGAASAPPLSSLPPKLSRTFTELKAAIAMKRSSY
jgi:Domain of unknown function (DUF4214)